jgi:hypothetical protein
MMFHVYFLRFIASKVGNTRARSGSCCSGGSTGWGEPGTNTTNTPNTTNPVNPPLHQPTTQSHLLKVYNSSLGLPTAAMRSGMREEFEKIMMVDDYGQFLARINLSFSPRLVQ